MALKTRCCHKSGQVEALWKYCFLHLYSSWATLSKIHSFANFNSEQEHGIQVCHPRLMRYVDSKMRQTSKNVSWLTCHLGKNTCTNLWFKNNGNKTYLENSDKRKWEPNIVTIYMRSLTPPTHNRSCCFPCFRRWQLPCTYWNILTGNVLTNLSIIGIKNKDSPRRILTVA